ncbi:hypothetical protein GC176_24510 [bacterium]|nr:hypothetical protein [bacterium]
MVFHRFRFLFNSLLPGAQPRNSASVSRCRFPAFRRNSLAPALQQLELRILPATFVVNTTSRFDSRPEFVGFTEAVGMANANPGHDTITFADLGGEVPDLEFSNDSPTTFTEAVTIDGSQPFGPNVYIGEEKVIFQGSGSIIQNITFERVVIQGSSTTLDNVSIAHVTSGEQFTETLPGETLPQEGLLQISGSNNTVTNSQIASIEITGNNNTISGNMITGGLGPGVLISGSTTGNRISQNSIFDSNGLGIDLVASGVAADGVTANDATDNDSGPNGLQNWPELTLTGNLKIGGTLTSAPGTFYTVEFFSSPTKDDSDNGEGQTFLSSMQVATDATGIAMFEMPDDPPGGVFITATVTDPNGNTSEFSNAVATPIDLSPLRVAGDFQFNETTEKYEAAGLILIGLRPADGDDFQSIIEVNGSVSYDSAVIIASGTVTSRIFNVDVPLFSGEWHVDVGSAVTSFLSEASQFAAGEFQLGGALLDFEGFEFVDPTGGSVADARIELRGTARLPDVLNGIDIAITGDDYIGIDAQGVSFTGVDFVPQGAYSLELNGFQLEASNLSLRYDNAASVALLGGNFELPQFNVTVDLTPGPELPLNDRNGFRISKGSSGPEVDFIGQIRRDTSIPLFSDWSLENLTININTTVEGFEINGSTVVNAPDFDVNDAKFPTSLSITAAEGVRLTATAGEGTDFRLSLLNVDVSKIEFVSDRNPGNGADFDPELRIAGKLSLPSDLVGPTGEIDGAGDLVFQVAEATPLKFNSDGFAIDQGQFGLTGFWKLRLFEVAIVQIDNPMIEFNAADPENPFVKFTTTITFPNLNNATFDFDGMGNNFVKLSKQGGVQALVDITIPDPINITDDGEWALADLAFGIDTVSNRYSGTGKLKTPDGDLLANAEITTEAFTFNVTADPPQSFGLLGQQVVVRQVTFTSDRNPGPGNGDDFDPEIEIRGLFQFSEELGNLSVEIDNDNAVIVNGDGVSLTGGRLEIPGDRKFVALGLLEIETRDAALDLNLEQKTAILQGTYRIPTLNDFQIDLSGERFLGMRQLENGSVEFAMNVAVSIASIPVYQEYGLQNVEVTAMKDFTGSGSVTGSAKIIAPGNGEFDLTLIFEQGRLSEASVSSPAGTDFELFGTDLDVRTLAFVADRTAGNDEDFEPEFRFQGVIQLPPQLESAELNLTGDSVLIVNESGVDLTGGQIAFPDIEFSLFNTLSVEARGLIVEYAGATESFRIQGLVTLPDVYDVTADFTGDSYIEISSNGVEIVGTLSADDIRIVPGVWEISEAELNINTTINSVTAETLIQIPTGIEVLGGLGFVGSELNFVSLGADSLNKPIGATGAFLQSLNGQINHIGESDPMPVEFGGGIGITGGPQFSINLPSWAGGTYSGQLAALNLSGSLNRDRISASGVIDVVNGLISGTGNATLDFEQRDLQANATFDALGGLITTTASLQANANFDLNMAGTATVTIPDEIPVVGGTSIGSGNMAFEFSNNGVASDDYVLGYGTVSLPFVGDTSVGFQVNFDGSFKTLGGTELAQVAGAATSDSVLTAPAAAPSGPQLLTASSPATYSVGAGTSLLLMTARWENESPSVEIQVTRPDGTVLTEADFASDSDIEIAAALTGVTRRTVAINAPEAGNWQIRVVDTEGLGAVSFEALGGNATGSIAVTGPASDVLDDGVNHRFTIDYEAFDADSSATVSLFYDTDDSGYDGLPLVTGLSEADGASAYNLRAFDIPSGDYYVYARLADGVNPPVFSNYSTGRILVRQTPRLTVTNTVLSEGDSGQTLATFAVNLTPASPQTVTVNVSSVASATFGEVPATKGTDFGDASVSSLSFAPGEVTKFVTVPVFGDESAESDETFNLQISNSVNAQIYDAAGIPVSSARGTGTIRDDDIQFATPTISVDPISVIEGSGGGQRQMLFNVRLSKAYEPFTRNVQMTARVVDGTASSMDYTSPNGSGDFFVFIFAGQTEAQVAINISEDAVEEGNETVMLQLSNPMNAKLPVTSFVGTILDDDASVTARIDSGGQLVVTDVAGQANDFDISFDPDQREIILNAATQLVAYTRPDQQIVFGSEVRVPLSAISAHALALDSGAFDDEVRVTLPTDLPLFDVLIDAGSGTDHVTVAGTPDAETHEINSNMISNGSASVTFVSGVESLTVDLSQGGADSLILDEDSVFAPDALNVLADGANDALTVSTSGTASQTIVIGATSIRASESGGGAGPDIVRLELPFVGFERLIINGTDLPDTMDASASSVSVVLNGLGGDDVLIGSDLPDVIVGGDGNDSLYGRDGNDVITGSGSDDVLLGQGGNDTLNGGAGKDELVGDIGDDSLNGGGSTGDTLDGGDGDDTLNGGSGNDLIREMFTGDATLTNSTMTGRGNDTVIDAERAMLSGGGTAQTIDASTFFTPGLTSVTLDGGGGNDTLLGSDGSDVLNGAGGSDFIDAGGGQDRIFGGSGADTLIGGDGDDLLKGLGGSGDRLIGGAGNDTLNGGRGIDRLIESADADFTLTNSSLLGVGSDLVQAIEIAEINAGDSDNLIDVSAFFGFKGFVQIRAFGGSDTVIGSAGPDVINGGDGNDSLVGNAGNDVLNGDAGDDILQGKEGDDTLNGGDGNDGLSGFTGNDVLNGERGFDRVFGGLGNDTLTGGNARDTLVGGDGDDSLAGNDGPDTLVGGTGNNDASMGDVFNDATATIDEAFTLDPLPAWVDQV